MHIVAMSDLHGWLPPDVPACDLLLIAGDVCPDAFGSGSYAHREIVAPIQARWLVEKFAPWLERQPARAIVMCWGNHDYIGEYPGMVPALPATVLTDAGTEVGGLRVYGMPWTVFSPRMWAFDEPEQEVDPKVRQIPADVEILITHGPPLGICDQTVRGDHAGNETLAEVVAQLSSLRLHVFGHIHEGRGAEGRHHNVSVLDENYQPHVMPITEIEV